GAVSGTLKGCTISGNTSLFGGGVGFASQSTVTGGSKTIFEDCVISNNTAKYGGAIYGQSYQGATCSFINCCIFGNKAESGSVIYVTALGPWQKKYAGKVDFIFCTIAGNKANDAGTFEFYDLIEETYAGFIDIKGSFIIDDSPYNSEDNDYNYIATKNQALEDGVITEESLDNFNINTRPVSGSKADITVPYEVYSGWIANSGNSQKDRFIGADLAEQTPDSGKSFPYWTLVFPALAVVAATIILIVVIRKKKTCKASDVTQTEESSDDTAPINDDEKSDQDTGESVDFKNYSYDELYDKIQKAYGTLLTKKEMMVAVHFLRDKSRKEIAQKLGVSDETIKSHLSNIYKKLGCSSKNDFKNSVAKTLK
ncbi:MAG: LuxR family transcriptional regulator, partial [Clostridia bacterium]|nr:LuxR family transcriptional regulator [Clostridia bacterium]